MLDTDIAKATTGMPPPPLAADHRGMKVDYRGMLRQSRVAMANAPDGAQDRVYLLEELERHLTELGERYYAGDVAVVDEFLQLYCIAAAKRPARSAVNIDGVAGTSADQGRAFYEVLHKNDPKGHPDRWENLASSWQVKYAEMAQQFFSTAGVRVTSPTEPHGGA